MSDLLGSSGENASFSISACKKVAKAQLNGRKTTPVLAVLIVTAIISVIYGCIFPFAEYFDLINNYNAGLDYMPDFSVLKNLIIRAFIVSLILSFFASASQLAILKLHNRMFHSSDVQSLKSFFDDYKFWWKAFRAFLWQGLWIILWELAIFATGSLFLIPGAVSMSIAGESGIALFSFSLGYIVFVIYAMVAVFWKLLQYSLFYFILADNDNVGVIDALRISRRMTKGYKWKLFLLELSFIGWILLSVLTCGILYLWILPYYNMAMTNAFMFLKRTDEERFGRVVEMEKQGSFVTPEQNAEDLKE